MFLDSRWHPIDFQVGQTYFLNTLCLKVPKLGTVDAPRVYVPFLFSGSCDLGQFCQSWNRKWIPLIGQRILYVKDSKHATNSYKQVVTASMSDALQ